MSEGYIKYIHDELNYFDAARSQSPAHHLILCKRLHWVYLQHVQRELERGGQTKLGSLWG